MAPMQLRGPWVVGPDQPYVIYIWETNIQIIQSSSPNLFIVDIHGFLFLFLVMA